MGLVIGDRDRMYTLNYKYESSANPKPVASQLSKRRQGEKNQRNTELSFSNRLFLKSLGYNVVSPGV